MKKQKTKIEKSSSSLYISQKWFFFFFCISFLHRIMGEKKFSFGGRIEREREREREGEKEKNNKNNNNKEERG